MPMNYELDTTRGLILTTASGILTDAEFRTCTVRLLQDEHIHANMRELCDFQAVTRFEVTSVTVQWTADAERRHPFLSGRRLAIVVASDIVYGMSRMYQLLSEDHFPTLAVFRDLAEAKAWLGIESD
jgi:hypothetical protein